MRWLTILTILLAFAAGAAFLDRKPVPLRSLQNLRSHEIQREDTKQESVSAEKSSADPLSHKENIRPTTAPSTSAASRHSAEFISISQNYSADEATEYTIVFGHMIKITDGALVVFTFFLVMIGAWQGYQLKRTVSHMGDSSKQELRAYIHIEPIIETQVRPMLDRKLSSQIKVKNSGKTFARHVITEGRVIVAPYPEPVNFPDAQDDETSMLAIGPGQSLTMTIKSREFLSRDCYDRFTSGTDCIYVYGSITYVDAFNRQQTTRFRLVMGAPTGAGAPIYCKEGNDAS